MKRFPLLLLMLLSAFAGTRPLFADDAALPGAGFTGDHYSSLWTKSPFAIATPEAGPASADYELVGMAQFDGVSYASLVVKQTQEHFVLTSEKPVRNLTLVSLQHDAQGASAVIDRGGERIVLEEQNAPAAGPSAAPAMPTPIMGVPLGNPAVGGLGPYPLTARPPRVRFHRPPIVIPPRSAP